MTNALPDPARETGSALFGAPQQGDIVLAPQADGGCLLAQHPGGWQVCFGSNSDAIALAVRYATTNGGRVWVRTDDNQYEPIEGAMPAARTN